MTSITYRAATSADLEALVALDAICFRPSVAYPRYVMRAFAFGRQSQTIVAEEAPQLAGFTIARLLPHHTADVVTLDVNPAFRRRGIATELLHRGEDWMRTRGVEIVYLEVDRDNENALKLYHRFGYVETDEFLEDGVPRYAMEKRMGTGTGDERLGARG